MEQALPLISLFRGRLSGGARLDSRLWSQGHVKEEILEEYAFGRLNEQETAAVEEHYLACVHCQESLETIEDEIRTVRGAFATAALSRGRQSLSFRALSWVRNVWAERQAMVLGGALAGAMVVTLSVYGWRSGSQPTAPTTVALASFRGAGQAQMAQAPAGRTLDLRIEGSGIPDPQRCRLELVNATGESIWTGPPQVKNEELQAVVNERLRAGQYWVRIYGSDNSLLREFGLRVQ